MSTNFNELNAAETFLAVVYAGSFASAAERLRENPSSVSRAVAQLESRLGVTLFARTTRTMRLTEAGEVYRNHAERMLEARQAARDELTQLKHGQPTGEVRLTMPVVIGERLLAAALPQFYERYPGIQLHVDLSDRSAMLLEEGVDLALRVGLLPDSTYRARRVANMARHIYASPAYLAVHGFPQHPNELANHACITFIQSQDSQGWRFWSAAQTNHSMVVPIQSCLACSSPVLISQAIQAGVGIGRSAEWLVRKQVEQGLLVPLLSDWRCEPPNTEGLPVWLLFPPSSTAQLPLKVQVVADFLERVISGDMMTH